MRSITVVYVSGKVFITVRTRFKSWQFIEKLSEKLVTVKQERWDRVVIAQIQMIIIKVDISMLLGGHSENRGWWRWPNSFSPRECGRWCALIGWCIMNQQLHGICVPAWQIHSLRIKKAKHAKICGHSLLWHSRCNVGPCHLGRSGLCYLCCLGCTKQQRGTLLY